MQLVYDGLRSPTEFESTPVIAHVLQEYFLHLLGRYREFVQPEGTSREPTPVSEEQGHPGPSLQRISFSGDIRARPSFRQSPRAAGSARPGAADDDGYLRCSPATAIYCHVSICSNNLLCCAYSLLNVPSYIEFLSVKMRKSAGIFHVVFACGRPAQPAHLEDHASKV